MITIKPLLRSFAPSTKKCGNRTMDNGTVKKVCWIYSTKVDQNAEIRALPGKKKEFSNI